MSLAPRVPCPVSSVPCLVSRISYLVFRVGAQHAAPQTPSPLAQPLHVFPLPPLLTPSIASTSPRPSASSVPLRYLFPSSSFSRPKNKTGRAFQRDRLSGPH